MRVNLTNSASSATKTIPPAGASGTGEFKVALQSASAPSTTGSTAVSRESRNDAQSKAKKKDSSTTAEVNPPMAAIIQQTGGTVPKLATDVTGPSLANDGPEEGSGNNSSITDPLADTGLSSRVTGGISSEWQPLPGVLSKERMPTLDEDASVSTDGNERQHESSQMGDALNNAEKDGELGKDRGQSPVAGTQNQITVAALKEIVHNQTSTVNEARIDAVPVTGTDLKKLDPSKPEVAASKGSPSSLPDTQVLAPPVLTIGQPAATAELSATNSGAERTPPNVSQEQGEGGGLSGRKNVPGNDSRLRRKSDLEAQQSTAFARNSSPEFATPSNAAGPSARQDQTAEELLASQAAAIPSSQDHSKTESPVAESSSSIGSASQADSDLHASDVAPMQALSGAHLLQSIHQSEMKLGLNSAEFGSISVSTSISHQVLSAQISLEHPELSRILSSHLHAAQEKLGQAYGLQTRVEVRDGSTGQSGTRERDRGSESARSRSASELGQSVISQAINPLAGASMISDLSRLDVRV